MWVELPPSADALELHRMALPQDIGIAGEPDRVLPVLACRGG